MPMPLTREEIARRSAAKFDMPDGNAFARAFLQDGAYAATLNLCLVYAREPYRGYPTPEAALLALAAQVRLVSGQARAIGRGEAAWPEHPEPIPLGPPLRKGKARQS